MTIIEHMKNQVYPRQIGEDRIIRHGDQLVICSKLDMDDWQVHETRKTAIIIDDEVWCLVGKQFTDRDEVHYVLEPYSDYLSQLPGRRIRYDENYVRACSEAHKKRKVEERGGAWLYPLTGIIGFLPSRRKAAIEKKFGISAKYATFTSVMIEFYILVLFGFLWWVFAFVGSIVYLAYMAVIVLFFDVVIRYGSYFRDDGHPLGFLEWFFRFLRRKFKPGSRQDRNTENVDLLYPYK